MKLPHTLSGNETEQKYWDHFIQTV